MIIHTIYIIVVAGVIIPFGTEERAITGGKGSTFMMDFPHLRKRKAFAGGYHILQIFFEYQAVMLEY